MKLIQQVSPSGFLPLIALLLVGLAMGCGDNLTPAALTCAAPTTDCDGTCRATQTDPANCGACGLACGADQVCGAGVCASTCPTGTTPCDGSCVNLASDVTHCGACGTVCSTDHGTPACTASTCGIAACDTGYYAGGGACHACSGACLAGQFEAAACSADADRVCSTCPAIAGCSSVSCTTSSNAVCNMCDAGLFWTGTACQACSTTACAAGTYEATSCTATADRTCGACPAIAGCLAETCTSSSNAVCNLCDPGLFWSGTACQACSTTGCAAGTYETSSCTVTADRTCGACTAIAGCANETCTTTADQLCLACASGSYLSGNTCVACSTASCPTGSIETAACSATADRTCGCTAIAGCASELCTTATDQTCLACDTGKYLSGGACASCTACRPGEFEETACAGTADATCAAVDCYALHVGSPGVGDGIETVDPDGPGGAAPFQAYCDMTSDGGGWTLLMKVDGSLTTFTYQSPLWTNSTTYQPDELAFDFVSETKSSGFSTMPFNAMRVGMFDLTDGVTRWLDLPRVNTSLLQLFTSGYQSAAMGREAWKGLLASPSLQPNCNMEGFNVETPAVVNARIGIVSNQENDCQSADSRIGIGTEGSNCGQDQGHSVGDEARCSGDNGDRSTATFGFVMVRNCPGGVCQCSAPLASCDALCVAIQTDVRHCGSCSNSCGPQQNSVASCVSGTCQATCNAGFSDCDANPTNGCEIDSRNDNANCGACGTQCTTNLTCTNGACLDATALQIDNPNGATVEYLPRSDGNRNAPAEGTCTANCTVHPTLGNMNGIRIRSSSGFASGCDQISRNGQCYVQLPAHVVIN